MVRRTLVGKGATSFARSEGIPLVPPIELVAETSRRDWVRWKDQYESALLAVAKSATNMTVGSHEMPVSTRGVLEDTVGAVASGAEFGMAAGVSR